MMSETMIGFEVAPLAPIARFFLTSPGSIESSHTFVPVAISDLSDMRNRPFQSNQPIQRIPTFKYSRQLPVTLVNLSINHRDSHHPAPSLTTPPIPIICQHPYK